MSETGKVAETERWELLQNLDDLIDPPLTMLGLVWLALVVVDLTSGLNSGLLVVTYVIWGLFILDYALELLIAPDRWRYLKSHWLGLVALAIPALRVLAVFRALRVVQSFRVLRASSLARILTSTNRALRSVRLFLGHRRLGFVLGSAVVVVMSGAAGIYAFERGNGDAPISNFGDALWWSAMMMTTMGSDFWPQTTEGRILAWLMAVYALSILGYITAYLASVFLRPVASN